MNCRRHLAIRKLTPEQQKDRALADVQPSQNPFGQLCAESSAKEPDRNKIPLEPDEDILLFIRDNNPLLADW